MKKKLLETIKYYEIGKHLIIGIGLIILNPFLFSTLVVIFDITKRSSMYELLQNATSLSLLTFYLRNIFVEFRRKRYKKLTGGRSYAKDHGKFKRTYSELVEYYKDAEPHKLDTSSFFIQPWRKTKGIVFGKIDGKLITIPSNSECNIAVYGPPGTGKTSGIAIINAMTFEGSVLAVDIKGDIYSYVSKHTRRKILKFCPDSPNALKESVRFDPFAELKNMNETESKLYLKSMAIVLIPDDGSGDNYFISRARKMFQGITHLILSEKPNASFPYVIHSILEGNIFNFVKHAINSDCTPAKELLASFLGNTEKNVTSAYDALTTALVPFSNPVLDKLLSNKSKRKYVSMETLEKGTDIYLQISQEHLDAYAPLFTLLIQSMSTAFTKRPDTSTGAENRPILMLLDEFPQLTFSQKLINSNLSTLRSKSVICMIIQQSLSQLEEKYKEAGSRSIRGNCHYQIILGSNDINSSKIFSDMCGYKKVLKISNSVTMSQNNTAGRSVQEVTEKVFQPEFFGDLAANNKMVLYFMGKYCVCDKINCYKN